MRLLLHSVALALVLAAPGAASETSHPMRARVFCDYGSGVTFRYPYDYFIPDQYVGGLVRERSFGRGQAMIGKEVEIDGKKVLVFEKQEARAAQYDVRCLSLALSELPSDVRGGDLAAIATHLAAAAKLGEGEPAIEWKPFDYYRTSGRPHGDPAWALPGIEGVAGEGGGLCGVVLKHGELWSGLIMTGGLTDHANTALIDSFEVLGGKGKERISWREGQGKQGKVIDADGKAVKADPKGKPVSWPRAWELETRHYHVTTMASSQRLLEYGAFLEGLYKAYEDVYDPDQIPPFKMEIHVFNTWQDFASGAAANGIPVGPSTGGFFVPSLLSIFAFEGTKAHFNSSTFTPEVVLAHECSHQFLHCTCNGSEHVPTWINEGLAVYFESGKFMQGKFTIMSPTERVNQLKAAYGRTKSTLVPLDQYLGHYGHIDALQYGEVYAMTHFWIFGSKEGKKRFKEYWLALKAGENGTESFERIFMADLVKRHGDRGKVVEAWQAMLMEYVKSKLK